MGQVNVNDMNLALQSYSNAAVATRNPRDSEYHALARLSHDLRDSARRKATDFSAFASAVSRNLEFWTIVATEVSAPNNALPVELRGKLLWLAEFVRVESGRLLRGEGDPESLVEINSILMQGLRPSADKP